MQVKKPLVSIIAPCYNEEAILDANIRRIVSYMALQTEKFDWEILIVNDGSSDRTGEIADSLTSQLNHVRVIHHVANMNLGMAIQTGFRNARGAVVVVMDIDLSYSETYIEPLVTTLIKNHADIVVASPYMKSGKVTAVPFMRRIMSKWVNRFMRMASQENYHTYTGMVRAYRKSFLDGLNLKARDYEINPEIMYKAMILRSKIIEIPAHLDWTDQNKFKETRSSSLRVIRSFFSGLMSGFIFRPYIFFIGIGIFLMVLSLYQLIWLLYDTLAYMSFAHKTNLPEAGFSNSLALQFDKNPHSFLIGGITFIIAIQFLSVGFMSLQSKRYFEELFHLGTNIKRRNIDNSNA